MTTLEGVFFSDKNFKVLMSITFDYFIKQDYEVGDNEEQLCMQIMNHVYEQLSPEQGEPMNQYLKRLNKTCLDRMIKIISSKLHDSRVVPQEKPSQDEYDALRAENTRDLTTGNDVNNRFDELTKRRQDENKVIKPPEPEGFGIKVDNDNSDIAEKFEEMRQNWNNDPETMIVTKQDEFEPQPQGVPPGAANATFTNHPENLSQDNHIRNEREFVMRNVPSAVNDEPNIDDSPPQPSGADLIIKQPEEYKKFMKELYSGGKFTKKYDLIVDSRDRDTDAYPNPNNYQIDFNEHYHDILSVELVSAIVPKSQYVINSSNNTIYFDEGSGVLTATIAVGNYTSSELATEIKTAMDLVGAKTYTVTVDSKTDKYTIAANVGTYDLLFNGGTEKYETKTRTIYRENSIGPVIGFTREDQTGLGTYTSQNRYNLNGEQYVILNIKELYTNMDSHSQNRGVNQESFTKINLDAESNGFKFFKAQSDYIAKKTFVPPEASIRQMNIEWRNYNGDRYDFGGLEHTLFFRVTTLNQQAGFFIN
jgi:phage anti-repressor protein